MRCGLRVLFAALMAALAPVPVWAACKCLITYPICPEVAASDVVFIGVAESVQPTFLDYWRSADGGKLPVDEMARLHEAGTPAALEKLRSIYLELAGDLSEPDRLQLVTAKSFRELEGVFNSITAGGVRTRFRVIKSYKSRKGKDDDDDEKPAKEVVIWTDAGECGIHFQTGETYMVYADNDEETGRLRTSICYRTQRLSDAGQDLSYLFYFERGGAQSSRLEGYVTNKRDQDRPTYTDHIEAPVGGMAVTLDTPGGHRFVTTSDSAGRFWFDGLARGDYQLSVFDSVFPRTVRQLAGPQRIRIPEKGCATDMLFVPTGLP
ncbi:MAG TPA: carboxypeptidase-like regulatory domain-containing protein [Bryobacteraceae bacterium]|nr:carboxypeptidase-like regulatory domain-containing protein [Bryobacteraceae bacterium]